MSNNWYEFIDEDDYEDIFADNTDNTLEEQENYPAEIAFEEDSEPMNIQNENIYAAQLFLNNKGYKLGDSSQWGIITDATKEALVKYLQFQLGYYGCGTAVDGKFNSNTLNKVKRFLPIQRNTPRTYLVKTVQLALLCHGYRINIFNSIDGIYSSELSIAVKQFQQDNDIPDTGKVDSETCIALFG